MGNLNLLAFPYSDTGNLVAQIGKSAQEIIQASARDAISTGSPSTMG